MRKGLVLTGGGVTISQVVDIARDAEEAGVDSLYVTEAWRSGFVMLTALALATRSIKLGSYILNAYGRSPWLTAMSAIDLDEVSGGRFVLGIGTGNRHINEDWQGIPQKQPLRKMEEYVRLLKMAVSCRLGDSVKFAGEVHSMDWSPAIAPLRNTIPIYLAGLYPGMISVAGRVADGIALGALLSPDYLSSEVLPRFHEAAKGAGRDPGELGTIVAPFVSIAEDAEHARKAARNAICRLYWPLPHPYYDFVLREQGFSAAADAAIKHVPAGRMEQAAEAFTDDVIDAVTISGTLSHCEAALAKFEGTVDETVLVNVNYSGTSQAELLEAYASLIQLAKSHPEVGEPRDESAVS